MTRMAKVFRSVKRCVEALEQLEPHEQRANLDYLFDRFVEQPRRDRQAEATVKVQEWRAANRERLAKLISEANAVRQGRTTVLAASAPTGVTCDDSQVGAPQP